MKGKGVKVVKYNSNACNVVDQHICLISLSPVSLTPKKKQSLTLNP